MEENQNTEEKSYLENFWIGQRIEIEGVVRSEIDKLILLSLHKMTLESNQVRNAEAQGINLMIPFPDSGKIERWVNEVLIQHENLTAKEFRNWLIEERKNIIDKAKRAKKHSFYFDLLKTIKTLLSENEGNTTAQDLKNQLIGLFKQGEVDKCFDLIEKNNVSTNEILQLQNQWNSLKKLKVTGQIGTSPSPDENRIKSSLLSLIQEINE